MGIAELQKKYYRKFLINQHLPYSYNCILQIIKALRTLTAIRSFSFKRKARYKHLRLLFNDYLYHIANINIRIVQSRTDMSD